MIPIGPRDVACFIAQYGRTFRYVNGRLRPIYRGFHDGHNYLGRYGAP